MRVKYVLACVMLVLAACSTSTAPVIPGGGGVTGHLYVGNDNPVGSVVQYNLPITPASVPNFTIPNANNLTSLALDASGHAAAGDNAGHIAVITTLPLSAASTPSANFNNGAAANNGQFAFTSNGNLYTADVSSHVNGFTTPFSNASVPATTTTAAGLVSAIGLTFDAAQNMYVSNTGGGGGNIFVFAPPYTGVPTVTTAAVAGTAYRKMAMTATQLFVANVAGAGGIYVYALPLTNASLPAFVIPNAQTPEALALDASGNLYSANLNNSTITEYTPPFSAASVPATTLVVGGGTWAIFGMAIGL